MLCHGFGGTGPVFTGFFIAGSTLALYACSRWTDLAILPCDALFCVFLICVGMSFAKNGVFADTKELELLALSLAAYPAGRLYAGSGITPAFIGITAAIVLLGGAVTAVALAGQWNDPHGKPLVFGEFDAAPAQFLMSLGFLVIALAGTSANWRRVGRVSAAIFLPAVIFAASMVRFTFVAIGAALVVGAIMASPRERKYYAAIILVVVAAVGAGLSTRSAMSMKFIHEEMASVEPPPAPVAAASSCPEFDHDNSILIREELLREALRLVPGAGLFGSGLNGFLKTGCIKNAEVHNSILQATIEFGWLAGAALALMIVVGAGFLLPLARHDLEVRFVLCSLVYVTIECMAYGRISRDALLFLFLGYASGLHNRLTQTAPQPEDEYSYHLVTRTQAARDADTKGLTYSPLLAFSSAVLD